MSTNKEKTTIEIYRDYYEFRLSLNEDKDKLTIEETSGFLIFSIRWKIHIRNGKGNKRLNCVELYNLLTQADMPDFNNLWHLKNTNHAVKYSIRNGMLSTAPVLNIWTNINDPFGSLYNIVLRRKKQK